MQSDASGMAQARPYISVILFVRNMAAYIESAVSSVLAQSGAHVELLVFDGASTDGTAEILARFRAHFAYFSPGPDGGPAYAINEGVARASGEVIVLLAGDDWLEDGSLREIATQFQSDPGLDVLCCGVRIAALDPTGKIVRERCFQSVQELEFKMEQVLQTPLTHGRILRKRVYQRMGPYDVTIPITHDLDFLIRCLLFRVSWKISPAIAYTFREHAGSRTLSGLGGPLARMARDNCQIARRHLRSPMLSSSERSTLANFLARATARAVASSLRERHLRLALKNATESFTVDPTWPLRAIKQLAAISKNRRKRSLQNL